MSTFTWAYDGHQTVVLNYSAFPSNSESLRLDCSDDYSNTPQYLNINAGSNGLIAIENIRFKYGNGPGFTATLSDRKSGVIYTTQDFAWAVSLGSFNPLVPGYGLELANRNDLTPNSYMDVNTVQRWTDVGRQDGLAGRPAQANLGTNQQWYDAGYGAGLNQRPYLSL